jgi:TonB family protein
MKKQKYILVTIVLIVSVNLLLQAQLIPNRPWEHPSNRNADTHSKSNSNSNSKSTPPPPPEGIFEVAEIMPQFPGGEEAMLKFLSKEIVYPAAAKEANIQGRVQVSFIVGTDGTLSQIKIARSGPDPLLDEEAIRAVKKMPKWVPGKQNSNPVNVRIIIPVVFRLQKN